MKLAEMREKMVEDNKLIKVSCFSWLGFVLVTVVLPFLLRMDLELSSAVWLVHRTLTFGFALLIGVATVRRRRALALKFRFLGLLPLELYFGTIVCLDWLNA